jgi:hypothetical protein
MKIRKLIKKYYKSIVAKRKKKIQEIYKKITKKSLKGKKTQAIQ